MVSTRTPGGEGTPTFSVATVTGGVAVVVNNPATVPVPVPNVEPTIVSVSSLIKAAPEVTATVKSKVASTVPPDVADPVTVAGMLVNSSPISLGRFSAKTGTVAPVAGMATPVPTALEEKLKLLKVLSPIVHEKPGVAK